MVIVYIVVGLLAGVLATLVALTIGATMWAALAIFSLTASGAIALSAIAVAARVKGRATTEPEIAETMPESVPESAFEHTPAAAMPAEPAAEAHVAEPAQQVAEPEPEPELETEVHIDPELEPVLATDMADPAAMRILAVDDDPFILELIPRITASAGFPSVTSAESAAHALQLVASAAQPFDCFLLDINMPETDGIELCKQIRNLPGYRDTPIIMLTAMTDLEYLNRAFRAGASDYTTKPFDIIDLGDRLQIAHARVAAQRTRTPPAVQVTERLVPADEMPALIGSRELASYISRLTGSALSTAYVMAVTAESWPEGESVIGGVTALPALVRTAKAIDAVFGLTRYVVAHAGNGQFLLVTHGAVIPDPDAVRAEILQRLDNDGSRDDEPGVRINVGAAVRLQTPKTDRARIAFESAITLAERRAAQRPAATPGTTPVREVANGGR